MMAGKQKVSPLLTYGKYSVGNMNLIAAGEPANPDKVVIKQTNGQRSISYHL